MFLSQLRVAVCVQPELGIWNSEGLDSGGGIVRRSPLAPEPGAVLGVQVPDAHSFGGLKAWKVPGLLLHQGRWGMDFL